MPRFKAEIHVTLKQSINDPQGLTIKGGLESLEFGGVEAVRAGKYLEVWLEAADQASAEGNVGEMCDKLLANPVIEDFRYEVAETMGA